MAVNFRLNRHSLRPQTNIVEIVVDGEVVGVLYPHGEKGVKLVSAHIGSQAVDQDFSGSVVEDDGTSSWPPIPSILVEFAPSPYRIVGNKIVRLGEKGKQDNGE